MMFCLGGSSKLVSLNPHSGPAGKNPLRQQQQLRPQAECQLCSHILLLNNKSSHQTPIRAAAGGGGGSGGGGCSFGNGGSGKGDDPPPPNWWKIFCCTVAGVCFSFTLLRAKAAARTYDAGVETETGSSVWQVKQGKWIRYVEDEKRNDFVVDVVKASEEEAMDYERECGETKEEVESLVEKSGKGFINFCIDAVKTTMLPVGYPKTVSEDYTEYTLWRMGQVIANQICCVLTTQALLYAVGLGKGAIPTAAAINWVLKDGIGYLSKIVLSKYGRHFDVHPKSWRLLSDLMEDAANGLELLTPTFPHLFVSITAVSGAGKSAAGLIQGATRSCFYAGFATQQNFAEVIAKGEAQGMVSKSLGIALGIGLSSKVGSSGPLLVSTFAAVTAAHLICNVMSYQAVQLHTLNPYRTGLIMAEYLNREEVLSVKDVNLVEPFFFGDLLPRRTPQKSISLEARQAAAEMEKNVQLGVTFGEAVAPTKETAEALFKLYEEEQYLLTFRTNGYYKVLLKESASPYDMLRAVVQASYHRHIQKTSDPVPLSDELLKLSYESMRQNFEVLTQRLKAAGWSAGGLVARPGSPRIVSLPASSKSETRLRG